MKNHILIWLMWILLALFAGVFISSIIIEDAKASYTDIMYKKMDSKILNRIIRSCENRFEELEDKKWRSVDRCIRVSFAIACNESSCGKRYANNSIHWVQKSFDTQIDWINYWTRTYYKYWYKGTEWAFFYWTSEYPAPTLYCTSEKSSNTIWHCPNWRANFDYYYNLTK